MTDYNLAARTSFCSIVRRQPDVRCWQRRKHTSQFGYAVADSENSNLATDADILVDAIEAVLYESESGDRNDRQCFVAKRVHRLAKAGVLDPVPLRDLTVKAVWR